eukprot:TRINITY_DN25083_c0_g1_i1.p1 TRINITY_DN25083_c0_g1~~TRINITY_DN25083_c0_g1_i1.p1  ORF type:complete len:343 (+),score=80.81 TRINITY_DN25083_c0_g1_i1:39-1067(+)
MSGASVVNWGILTCGKVSSDFVWALKITTGANIVACAARNLEDAKKFGQKHGIPNCYGSYKELVQDSSVHVVYIGSIHVHHFEHSLLALNHGKHILVEKPMGINRKQTEQIYKLATEKNLYVMEGMWTAFNPTFVKAKSAIDSGVIGEVKFAEINFGVAFPKDIARIWEPQLGGGALLDIGIYPLYGVQLLLGNGDKPIEVKANGFIEGGIDVAGTASLKYPNNRLGVINWNAFVDLPETATIVGTKGKIVINPPYHAPTSVTISPSDGKEETFQFPLPDCPNATWNFTNSVAFTYEAAAVQQDLLAGKKENSTITKLTSQLVADILEDIKSQIGLKYPSEI